MNIVQNRQWLLVVSKLVLRLIWGKSCIYFQKKTLGMRCLGRTVQWMSMEYHEQIIVMIKCTNEKVVDSAP